MAAKIAMLCLSLLLVQSVLAEGRPNYLQVFQQMFHMRECAEKFMHSMFYKLFISYSAMGGCEYFGHTDGCCDPDTSNCLGMELRQNVVISCSCDEACHATNTCCHDIEAIGCHYCT